MTVTCYKYNHHKIKHSLQNNRSLKRVLLSICVGLLLSGCARDFVTAPFWLAKEVAGGARAHLPTPKLTATEKAILDKNIARLIEKIKWIDQYNVQHPNNQIYLYFIGNLADKDGCVLFSSKVELPVMWIEPKSYDSVYDCPSASRTPQYGGIFNEEQNILNNKIYPNLRKYYGVSNSLIFIYALDKMKNEGLAFPNIPVTGIDDYYINPSGFQYVATFNQSTSAGRYIRSVFTSNNIVKNDHHSLYKEIYDRYMSEVQPPQN